MGLRAKLTLLLIGVLVILSSLTVLVMNWDARRQLEALDITESQGDMRRLLVSLDAQMMQVDAVLGSWANWTSLYDHAEKANPVFVRDELNPDGLRVAHIDWLLRLTPTGTIGDQVEVPHPDGSLPLTAALGENAHRLDNYVKRFKENSSDCGVIQTVGHLSFACYRPLHDTAGGGKARGWVVIGRWIGPGIINSIKEQTDLNFELTAIPPQDPTPAGSMSGQLAPMESRMGSGAPIISRQDDQLALSFPIIGIAARHIGDLRMQWPRRSMASAQRAMAQTRNTLLLLLVGAALVLILLIDQLIVRRLRRLKRELGSIVGDHDWNGTISTNGGDEIAELAQFAAGLMGVLRAQLVELRELSAVDTLTRLPNRRTFDARLTHVVAQHARAKRPASLILIDIDHFKRYNDTYGHPAGDVALQRVAECLRATLRRQLDLPARLGGEEFAVICDETELSGAMTCADLIRRTVLETALPHAKNPPLGILSISLGVASLNDDDTPTTLYQRADKALYLAKEGGRNCCRSAE